MGIIADERDFDDWTQWVTDHIEEALGLTDVMVEQFTFTDGPDRDDIDCDDDDTRDAIRTWLATDGWDAWCVESSGDEPLELYDPSRD